MFVILQEILQIILFLMSQNFEMHVVNGSESNILNVFLQIGGNTHSGTRFGTTLITSSSF